MQTRAKVGDVVLAPATTVEILYGSQTGNSEHVARDFQAAAAAKGLDANVTELNAFGVQRLSEVPLVIIVCSTYNEGNEGDMPDNAVVFWRALAADDAPRLDGLRYSVLALGDDGYFDFCHAGQLIDERLEKLGAERIEARVDCDIYFEEPSEKWTTLLSDRLATELPTREPVGVAQQPAAPRWDRRNPFRARIVSNRLLSKEGSQKEVRHYEVDLSGSGIRYTVGDAIAVQPLNDPTLVDLLLDHLGLDGDVDADGRPLRERLMRDWDVRTPSLELIAELADRDPGSELADIAKDRDVLEPWLYGRDLLDILQASPGAEISVDDLARLLRPLQAREFSIASSPSVKPDSVELTVSTIRHGEDRERRGVATTYLSDRVSLGETVDIYPQPNSNFGLPDDDSVPIIMIGPGTGIAPFRGFLQERQARGATGKNWLFFGDRRKALDYLYEDEITAWAAGGIITRLDLAFSRDTREKDYVQTRMLESGSDLFDWLEAGAIVYVCGNAERMAKDVESALLQIIAEHGGRDSQGARAYLEELILAKRYLRDTY